MKRLLAQAIQEAKVGDVVIWECPKEERMRSKCCKKPVNQITVLKWNLEGNTVWKNIETQYYFYVCSECGKPTNAEKSGK